MGTNVCVVALLLTVLVTVVHCTTERQRKGCDIRCQLQLYTHPAGKRKKSVDLNQDGYPWKQVDTLPTFTADVMTDGQRSTCIFDEVLKTLSPKWQERLLVVLEGALTEKEGGPVDDGSFGL